MPKPAKQEPWVLRLKEEIKEQHRFGYSIRMMRGKVQLQRYWQDSGKREAGTLPIEWRQGCGRDVLNAIHGINAALAKGLNLKDAIKLSFEVQKGPKPKVNWLEAYNRFHLHKTESGKVKETTWISEYAGRLLWMIDLLNNPEGPNNGEAIVKAMRFGRDGKGQPGSRSRRLRVERCVAFLDFAVSKCGAPARWTPPPADVIKDALGDANNATTKAPQAGQAAALSDKQFLLLFDSITNPSWKLAIGLIGCFGLRGVELRYLTAHTDYLHCSYEKHTEKGSTDARDIPILDPQGRKGLCKQLLMTLSAGITPLPPLGSEDGATSGAIDTFLSRNKVWKQLKRDAKAAGRGRVSTYSLRHCFAQRCGDKPSITPKAAAVAMGHSEETHLRIYQKQYKQSEVNRQFAEAN